MYDYSKLTIIIPTLNEAKNIKILIGKLLQMYKGVHIIVVDDGSTDATKAETLFFSKKADVKFLDRSNEKVHGLTASVLDAAQAVNTRDIIVMDADLQHPPEKVKKIAQALESCNLVIGIREEVKDWGVYRKLVSKSVSTFCNVVFAIRGKKTSNDIMSGFFGIKSVFFKSIIRKHKDSYIGTGYKVLLETLKFIDSSEKVIEVPYTGFHDRVYGKSKAGTRQLKDIIKATLR
ncbi:MAG: glycosyltransferase [Candidatus Marsarchaeota archaeon]|jgi:dolichol-phosphate mannosyltransferase|nr:glycosyltransferase [Candidatus Marsarchaeota archaeon]